MRTELENVLGGGSNSTQVENANNMIAAQAIPEPAPNPSDGTIIFDSHITKVTSYQGTWTESGQTINAVFDYLYADVTLEDGYVIDTITHNGYVVGSEVTVRESSFDMYIGGSDFTLTITSKKIETKQTVDVSTLTGWNSLSSGNHSITIKAVAKGYSDSASSNSVTVNKEASGHKLTVNTSFGGGSGIAVNYTVDGTSHSVEDIGTSNPVTNIYNDVSSFHFDISYPSTGLPSIGFVWSVISTQLGINLVDQDIGRGVVYTSDTFTLTEDTEITISDVLKI